MGYVHGNVEFNQVTGYYEFKLNDQVMARMHFNPRVENSAHEATLQLLSEWAQHCLTKNARILTPRVKPIVTPN